ncbi:hypothetical protein ITJ55_00225 [Frigoribacterium sp. VKM Ac-1396]|uniref:hypothetical protein n=1 Tax=Frigoribacterium sp. VKM Ac-1396 TaxID=2783821 RepID=UPI00188C1BAC|nr:hypothetical protein [Frigoribacterium sp. VKM Ac-1396]MBF4599227.1 hypothetical protein [Frigoribacterium sp. VKM Ac-1396]
MVNLIAFVPALLTAAILAVVRWAPRSTRSDLRRWGTRALVFWTAVAAGALVALLAGLRLQHADLAVWSAFALIAASAAAVTAVAVRLVSSFAR